MASAVRKIMSPKSWSSKEGITKFSKEGLEGRAISPFNPVVVCYHASLAFGRFLCESITVAVNEASLGLHWTLKATVLE